MSPWKTASALFALLLASPVAEAAPRGPGYEGPGGRPDQRDGKNHAFGPRHRPGVNRKDFRKHLLPKEAVSLYYTSTEVEHPGTIDMAITMKNPAVVLEDIEAITSVVCGSDGKSLTISFDTTAAFTTALEDWDIDAPVVLITSEDQGCSPELERAYFVSESIMSDAAELTIIVVAHQEALKNIAGELEMDFTSLPAATLTKRVTWDPNAVLNFETGLEDRIQIFKNSYLDVAVEEAAFATDLTFSGHLSFSFLTFTLKELNFDVAAAFDASATISAQVHQSYIKTIKYEPSALQWSVVDVPGVVSLGPGIQFGLQFDFHANAKAGIMGGFGFTIPSGHIHLDIKNGSLSTASGWKPKWTTPTTALTQSAQIGVDIGAFVQVEMTFDLLDGVVDASAGISATPAIHNTFTLRGDQSVSTTKLLLPASHTCGTSTKGVQLISDFVFTIQAYATKYWSRELYNYEKRLFQKCYNFKL